MTNIKYDLGLRSKPKQSNQVSLTIRSLGLLWTQKGVMMLLGGRAGGSSSPGGVSI